MSVPQQLRHFLGCLHPGLESKFHSQFQLPANVPRGRQQVLFQVLASPQLRETRIEFLIPGFGLAWSWLFHPAVDEQSIPGSLSFFSGFQIKWKLFLEICFRTWHCGKLSCCCLWCWHTIRAGWSPGCCIFNPVPCYCTLGKQQIVAHVLRALTHMGDLDGVLGSWLPPGPTLGFEAIWGMSQQVEHLFLFISLTCCLFSCSLFLRNTAFKINN